MNANARETTSLELLAYADKLITKMNQHKRPKIDDSYATGYENGAFGAYNEAIKMIHDRLDELLGKGELDG